MAKKGKKAHKLWASVFQFPVGLGTEATRSSSDKSGLCPGT